MWYLKLLEKLNIRYNWDKKNAKKHYFYITTNFYFLGSTENEIRVKKKDKTY